PLGGAGKEADPKALGYGAPFEIGCVVDGARRSYVVSRTRPARGYGHDYPADRAWQALYGHAAYNTFPRHVRSVDVGFIRGSGEVVPAGDAAQFFQLVEKAEGDLYWLDLERLRPARSRPTEPGIRRAGGRAPCRTRRSETIPHSTRAACASSSVTASASWGSSIPIRIRIRRCRPTSASRWSTTSSRGAGGFGGERTGCRACTATSIRGTSCS